MTEDQLTEDQLPRPVANRSPKGLDRRTVVLAALRAIDAHGPHSLTMRGLGQDLGGDGDLGGRHQAGKGAALGEGGQGLRALPGERAAERPLPGAQRHGQEAVAALGQPRAGEAEQQAAAPPPAPAEDDATTQLQNLANLHAQGVLTDEEFAASKAKILGI